MDVMFRMKKAVRGSDRKGRSYEYNSFPLNY
jgi:hypothetical protein